MLLGDGAPDREVCVSEVSELLRAWSRGETAAHDQLLPLVYAELRKRAAVLFCRERANHTLQPTALVHETYLRLAGQQRTTWQNRAHFFGIAAQMMRRILVDHARERQAIKRPAGTLKVELSERTAGSVLPIDCEVLLLDRALDELSALDSQQARIVELRYFTGLSESEVASALGVSRSTVTREWQAARAWLYRRLTQGPSAGRS
jgi:RNA polymerase sigma factor (TIGR02999 family)